MNKNADVTSQWVKDEDAEEIARDGFWHNEMIKNALFLVTNGMCSPTFPDLRGKRLIFDVSEDGMHVHAEIADSKES